ncbi:bpX6 domain-containing protein [Lysobacter sp. Root604]|uniref:bpX6 domain-containing protein n=1 Tax=Lysobacter sp. Root604 TaxID=1736568 RepID=UPI00070201BF|nr:bpX6 domain-containing protein [Lysobacter sp. Root604]KRA21136.1 hypothetical protein ASD69_07610 [Lysobacter sp. Root604]
MSDSANVRHPVWRGQQAVSGLWFPSWIAPDLRSARLLAAWVPGCRAYRFATGDALCFPQPRILVCETTQGLALCRIQGGMYSAPLTSRELARLPATDIGIVQGAQVLSLTLEQAIELDMSASIDVGGYALHDTYDCRIADAALKVPRLDGKSVRSLLGDKIPPQSKDSEALLRDIADKQAGREVNSGEPRSLKHGIGAARDSIIGLMLSAFFRAVPGPATGGASARAVSPRRRPNGLQPWRERMARLAMLSKIAKLIGYRQGAHLRRMMNMFERGDLNEALRNAIPLGGLAGSLGPAFSAGQRRQDLRLSTHLGPSSSIGIGEDLQSHLRRLYRTAFERFDCQGSIDEAVFVLAELLNARQEALDYLVKHGRHSQAAELALGWDMPPGMIIRLLMLSGDTQRALQVARRDDAFSEAIQHLQASHPKLADELRLEWGHAKVQRGDWLGAVDAIWQLPHARDHALAWLKAAEEAGTELSARALVQRAALLPETLQHYAARIEVLSDPLSEPGARSALAGALLVCGGKNETLRALATSVLPAVAADRAAGQNNFSNKDLSRLLKISNDAYLIADVPRWAGPKTEPDKSLWLRTEPLALQAPRAGLHEIHDAAALPGGRYLVALGESGAAILDSHGRIRQRYTVPAFKLVLADSGEVALAIAPREQASRVSRLDLVNHAIVDLGVIALQFAAPRFDGIGWTVVMANRIVVIDTAKDTREVLWHVADLPGPIVAAGFFSDREIYLVGLTDGLQDWSYALPGRRLQARSELRLHDDRPLLPHRLSTVQQPQVRLSNGTQIELCYQRDGVDRYCVLSEEAPAQEFHCTFVPFSLGMIVGLHEPSGSRYFVVRLDNGTLVAKVDWPAGALAFAREQAEHLLFHDATGRLLDVLIARSSAHAISVL